MISGALLWCLKPSGIGFYCLHTTTILGDLLAPIWLLSLSFLSPIVCEVRGDIRVREKEEVGDVARGEQTTQKQRMEQ